MKLMNPLYPIFKRLIVALLCLIAVNAVVSCEGYGDYVKKLKFEEQTFDKHEWQKYKQLTKDEAKAEWEPFLSDIITNLSL